MWVVKLGGSLWRSAELHRWLACIGQGPGPARLIVPGGGPFADAVRTAQPIMGFSDLAAHRMAILAMQQYGTALSALAPDLEALEAPEALAAFARADGAGLWLPWRLAGEAPELEASWALTSDSLACWLATRLAADELLLVKSGAVPAGSIDVQRLVTLGLLDSAFPDHLRLFGGRAQIVASRVIWHPGWWADPAGSPCTIILPE